MRYCIDTSALMDGWRRWYPPDLFPSFWNSADVLVIKNILISSEEVLRELEKKDDELHDWAKQRKTCFFPLDEEILAAVSKIMATFPKLVDERTGKSFADPFVIATAMTKSTSVVTGEVATGKADRPRIPDVCKYFGIKTLNLVDLIREQGWRF